MIIHLPRQIQEVVVLLHCLLEHLINIKVITGVVREEFPVYKVPLSEVARHWAQPPLVADGEHGQLCLGGEHHVGHGGGDVLGGALEYLVDNGADAEPLRGEA